MAAWCNIRYKWFSLHAGVAIKGGDRDGLKRLCRYAGRSSVAVFQLSYVTPEDPDRSDVELRLKRTWRDGTGSITEPETITETLARLGIESTGRQRRYGLVGSLITCTTADDDEVMVSPGMKSFVGRRSQRVTVAKYLSRGGLERA